MTGGTVDKGAFNSNGVETGLEFKATKAADELGTSSGSYNVSTTKNQQGVVVSDAQLARP